MATSVGNSGNSFSRRGGSGDRRDVLGKTLMSNIQSLVEWNRMFHDVLHTLHSNVEHAIEQNDAINDNIKTILTQAQEYFQQPPESTNRSRALVIPLHHNNVDQYIVNLDDHQSLASKLSESKFSESTSAVSKVAASVNTVIPASAQSVRRGASVASSPLHKPTSTKSRIPDSPLLVNEVASIGLV